VAVFARVAGAGKPILRTLLKNASVEMVHLLIPNENENIGY